VLLKTRGPQTAANLGTALAITGEAARQQLVKLAAEGLVEATSEPRGVGRPHRVWTLTEKGNARFPDNHAELTAHLLRAIQSELGQAALDRLIAFRAAESLASYTATLQGAGELGERVRRLAEIRTREGYMAECHPTENGYLLVENHCPICVAATTCQGLCWAEQEVFQQALGKEVSVERTEHIIQGDRRCAYRIALKCVPEPVRSKPKRRDKA
jgi:predicted ArsR family transcriptional regulator